MEKKKNLALRCGVNLRDFKFDASTKTEEVLDKIRQLNKDRTIHGIVIKTPLPCKCFLAFLNHSHCE